MKEVHSSKIFPRCLADSVMLAVLVVTISSLLYISLYDQSIDTIYNVKRGALAVVIGFALIIIGMVHMPALPFIKPHPIIWRVALCTTILYILLLLFTLFQSIDDVRKFLRYYDSNLGTPLLEKTYAEDCRIYTPDHPNGSFVNIMDKMDEFVPAHFFGWYVKALLLRDVWPLYVLSIGFELLEYTLECQLPNFGECWWDHWILDLLLCNSLGIYCGMKTCELLSMETYDWRGLWNKPTFSRTNDGEQFVSCKEEKRITSKGSYSFTNFVTVVVVMLFSTFQQLNVFYLKSILWVPPSHHLNLCRQLMFGFCALCAAYEHHEYMRIGDPNAKIGRFTWMFFIAINCELLLEIKFGWDILSIPPPTIAIVSWSLFFLGVAVWATWKFYIKTLIS